MDDLASMTNDEFFKILQSRQESTASQPTALQADGGFPMAVRQGQTRHTAIPIGQLQSFLTSGCRFVANYITEEGKPMAIVEIAF